MATRERLVGVIASAGFASGDRAVIGHWQQSPIGPFSDLMWADPDGKRTLFVGTEAALAYVTSVYAYDDAVIVPFSALGDDRHIEVSAGDRYVSLTGGRRIPVAPARPAWFTRYVEGPIARTVMNVQTYGRSPMGVQEWYQARSVRRVVAGRATRAGVDLGAVGPVRPATGFGFSEPPAFPSLVRVTPLLQR